LWSDSYDGDLRETLTLQDNVARTIAEQIRINLNAQERATLTHGKVVDPRAYEAYLKGRYFWNKRTGDDFEKAVEYFNQAIQRDPHYAQAYSGLADTSALSGDWEYGDRVFLSLIDEGSHRTSCQIFEASTDEWKPDRREIGRRGSMMSHGAGVLHFVQISDTHIGFDKPANTDVTATLRAAIANIKADPEPPAFVLHTGDLTHCRRLLNSTRCSRSFPTCRCLCSMCPASTTYSRTTARATCSDSARGPAAPAGIASTTAASTSSAW